MTAPWCAVCTASIPRPINAAPAWTPRQEPLGRNDALVSCCEQCATERPRAWASDRNYEPPGGLPNVRNVRAALNRFAASVDAQSGNANRTPMLPRSPGFVLVRVAIKDRNGKTRDAAEAKNTLRGEPWYRALRHLGSTTLQDGVAWHLFERPPVVVRKNEIAPDRPGRVKRSWP